MEEALFFRRDNIDLFGILHQPDGTINSTAFVISHPFGEEKLWSHRAMVTLARTLAEFGYPVLRFDYMGAGDSGGSTEHSDLSTYLLDLSSAIEVIRRSTGASQIGLIGIRFGATVAAIVAEHQTRSGNPIGPLLLYDPILDGERYLQELLRINLGTQLAVYGKIRENRESLQSMLESGHVVNIEGYEIGQGFFQTLNNPALIRFDKKIHNGPTAVVQISATSKQKLREDLRNLSASYPNGYFLKCEEQPFWREIKVFYSGADKLTSTTLEWLRTVDA